MRKRLIVLTGSSRGIGEGIGLALCQPGTVLLGLSRSNSARLKAQAASKGSTCQQLSVDLFDPPAALAAMTSALQALRSETFESAAVINNAGTLDPIGPAETLDSLTLDQAIRLNLTTPIALTGTFLKTVRGFDTPPPDLRILNISSGAARRPISGWGAYCAAKAGLDHFSSTLHHEEQQFATPNRPAARVVSLAPGVVDTQMQDAIRAQPAAAFPDLAHYQALHSAGQLAPAETVGNKISALLFSPKFGEPVIADLRTISI